MRALAALLCGLAAAMALPVAAAPPAGASSCTGCHGPAGPMALDGRPAAEVVAAMTAFRNGQRPSTVMSRIARGFSDAEVRAIAEWFAGRPARGRRAPP